MAKRKPAETKPEPKPTEVAEVPPQTVRVEDSSEFSMLLDSAEFEHAWRVATLYSQSTLVPESFRNNPANCFIGLQMAIRCGVDPFAFLQKCYVIHGKPAIETQLAIALA